jgi:hypothetical protein
VHRERTLDVHPLPHRAHEHGDTIDADAHVGSTSQLLRAAQQLGPAAHTDAIDSFTDAMAAGFRIIAVVVLVAAIVTGRRPTRSTNPART